MRHSFVYLVLATLALAASAAAQDSGGYGDGGGMGMHRGHRGGMRGSDGMASLDPILLVGPPAPAEFARIVELPEDRVAHYTQLYAHFMGSTRPQRDSLDTLRSGMSAAFAEQDRDAMSRDREQMAPLARGLSQQQTTFDDTLKGMLDKQQWDRYGKWREDQRKQAAKDRQERWHHRGDQVPPA